MASISSSTRRNIFSKMLVVLIMDYVTNDKWVKQHRRIQNPIKHLKRSFLQNYLTAEQSSRPEVFCKKGVLRDFAKFTGKHLCQRLFFDKVAGLRSATFLKKRLGHRCFPVNFAKFLRTHFLTEHLRWLLLTGKLS